MSDVPSELHREILLQLPAESLFRCRSVCKAWVRIIDDSSFIKAHTSYNSHTLLVLKHSGDSLYSFSLDSFNFKINGPQMIGATRIENLIHGGFPCIRHMSTAASCNGLLFVHDDNDIMGIFNPLTKDFHRLPKPSIYRNTYGFGFGYDLDSDDYKVVIIYYNVRHRSRYLEAVFETLIYSLNYDSWKKAEDSPCPIESNGTFLDGSLYWASENAITALDLGTERYCQLPLPPAVIPPYAGICLVALDGCLICSLNYCEKKTFDGWMMKDTGVEKTWIKLFSLHYPILNAPVELKLVALKRKVQVLLHHYLHGFLWFDIESNSIKEISIHGLDISSCIICPGSLVRLNDYLDSDIEVKWKPIKTKITNTRLEFYVRNVDDMGWHSKE